MLESEYGVQLGFILESSRAFTFASIYKMKPTPLPPHLVLLLSRLGQQLYYDNGSAAVKHNNQCLRYVIFFWFFCIRSVLQRTVAGIHQVTKT